jgi:hypothetical protein
MSRELVVIGMPEHLHDLAALLWLCDIPFLGNNSAMKTTVDIPDRVLDCAMRYAKAKTKRTAIVTALEEFNRRHQQAELIKYFGRFDSLMTNDEIESLDATDSRRSSNRTGARGAAR